MHPIRRFYIKEIHNTFSILMSHNTSQIQTYKKSPKSSIEIWQPYSSSILEINACKLNGHKKQAVNSKNRLPWAFCFKQMIYFITIREEKLFWDIMPLEYFGRMGWWIWIILVFSYILGDFNNRNIHRGQLKKVNRLKWTKPLQPGKNIYLAQDSIFA